MSRGRSTVAATFAAAVVAAATLSGCEGSGHPVAPASGRPASASGKSHATSARWSVAAENRLRGTTRWKLTKIGSPGAIDGYAGATSVLPGQPVTLYVSTPAATWTATAYRMGWYAGRGGRQVWTSSRQRGVAQPAPSIDAARHTVSAAGWRRSLTVATAGWAPGDYVFVLRASTGDQRYVPLVVRSASTAGTVVVMNSALTWQAYNAWGGYSLYHGPDGSFASRAYAVTFDRPYDANGADKFMVYERPLVAEAERLGLKLSYETDIDVATHPGLLHGAISVLSLGHDEYWTASERAAVVAARNAGANLAFFGANEAYWQVRLGGTKLGSSRLVVEYKNASLDPTSASNPQAATTQFRALPKPEPESQLSGLMYECFPAEGDYVVEDPAFWGFAGTGVRRGTKVPGVVGVEIDRAYPVPATPRPLDVVAHSPVTCRGVGTWSDSAYYAAPSGAGVFSTGTMHWTCVLVGSCRQFGATAASQEFVRRVTDNVLRGFAAGPAGRAHPVTNDDLDMLHEPTVNQTGGS